MIIQYPKRFADMLPLLSGALVVGLLSLACNGTNGSRSHRTSAPVTTETVTFRMDTINTGLNQPWGMVWLPDGRMLVTEREGAILLLERGAGTGRRLEGSPETYVGSQGGLMDIQLHPRYTETGWIYVTYAMPDGEEAGTALMRFKLQGNRIADQELLYRTAPPSTSGIHFGSRLVFDREGYLYFSAGDHGTREDAQDLANGLGKIHRLHDDGRIPADNPFVNHPGANGSIWSYGHGNIQGMAYDAVNDILYATEHGARGGDELNIIEKGKNYGWPVITYGLDDDGTVISESPEQEGMEQPIHYWTPAIAPCGLLLYTGSKYAGWEGNLFAGALAQRHVARIVVVNGRYRHEEKLLLDIGRIRQLAQGPDGLIYVLTEDPGMLLRLVPSA